MTTDVEQMELKEFLEYNIRVCITRNEHVWIRHLKTLNDIITERDQLKERLKAMGLDDIPVTVKPDPIKYDCPYCKAVKTVTEGPECSHPTDESYSCSACKKHWYVEGADS